MSKYNRIYRVQKLCNTDDKQLIQDLRERNLLTPLSFKGSASLFDRHDQGAIHLGLYRESDLVCSVRINPIDHFKTELRLAFLESLYERMSGQLFCITALSAKNQLVDDVLITRLFGDLDREVEGMGVRGVVMLSPQHLLKTFQSMGFRLINEAWMRGPKGKEALILKIYGENN